MSDTVTIQKEVEVTIYQVTCSDCSKEVTFEVTADNDGDLRISVDRCGCGDSDIESEAYEQGRQEERDNHTCEGQA